MSGRKDGLSKDSTLPIRSAHPQPDTSTMPPIGRNGPPRAPLVWQIRWAGSPRMIKLLAIVGVPQTAVSD
jgi:hypothetical protein